ncbi:MAG: HIT family protein [Nanoarchaeota archaeon]|nr:HIT family protein [Nanoarchaeota archaeon]MBU1501265.1 HIT family protein [Nanoarchaeota archaeon]MBU2459454.1 HIT family protein [Nanoarchaeota archaeon]
MTNEENDCVFCKIVRGEMPCHKIWEDENFLAFADANPVVEDHTLVIPKKHFSSLSDINEEICCGYIGAIKETGKILVKKCNADGFNVALNNGEAAGQVVNHVHFHIHPRKKGDGLKLSFK